jgi:putative ABC transport system permease protein
MWLNDIRIAMASLRSARVRTSLTVLGVVIGVASIVTILAFSEGAQRLLTNQVAQFGGNVLSVRSGKLTRDASGKAESYDVIGSLTNSTLTEDDAKLVASADNVSESAPIMNVHASISSKDATIDDAALIATDQETLTILNQKLKIGEFINKGLSANTIVLGEGLAVKLLGSDQTIGQQLTLKGRTYTLVGVLNHTDIPMYVNGIVDSNNSAFISVEAGKSLNNGSIQYQAINFRVIDASKLHATQAAIEKALTTSHGANDVSVVGEKEATEITKSFFSMVTMYTTGIAGIALLVAGISIMNIMLVSVSERTKEIGIRKAIGATNAQVLRQFMVEALAMSLTGGIVGLLISYIITLVVNFQFNFMPVITWQTAILAPVIALLVGILFGTYPALKASRKDPIESLRQLS